ncbi:MAG: hypothetical protein JXP73_19670 [Deltaproteobacteria bacterium]|nr:hypothetical protein [Deltaproteobacteria bacterium]
MNSFDYLMVGFAVLSAVALYQMRPCTLILAGNNMLACRALSGVAQAGKPPSQWYLPTVIFAQDRLDTAASILTLCLVLIGISTVVFVRSQARIGADAPRVPRWLLVAIGIYLVGFAGATSTIFTGGHAGAATIRYSLNLGGAHAMLTGLVIYELARRRLLGSLGAWRAFLIAFVVFLATGYSKGTTGFTTGSLVVAAVLLLPRAGASRRLRNSARVAGVLLGIVFLSFVVRGSRTKLAEQGIGAIGTFLDMAEEAEARRDSYGEGAESVANAHQTVAHMLECVDLYDSGNSREWRSIYNVVEYTLIPSFFMQWFGWTRSIEPAWELARHFIHGGGINLLGELYWNGGFLCVVVVFGAIVLFCAIVDVRYRASPFWLMMATQFGPSLLMGYGYGFPQVSRGAINGLLAVAAYKVYLILRGAPAQPPEGVLRTIPVSEKT